MTKEIDTKNTRTSHEHMQKTFLHLIRPSDAPEKSSKLLRASCIETQLGTMIALADDDALYLLEFMDHPDLEKNINRLKKDKKVTIIAGNPKPITMLTKELNDYFCGNLKAFSTPLVLRGSTFQATVWKTLKTIPYGTTQSYKHIATSIGKPTAFRAVAQANSTNHLAIIIPCHRVIYTNGTLGGYSGGVARKQWLLDHEKKNQG